MCANSPTLSSGRSAINASAAARYSAFACWTACGASEMPAERAGARHGTEQTVQMPRDGVQSRTLRQFAFDVGHERHRRCLRRGEAGGFAKDQRIDGDEPPWFLVGRAAHHHAIDTLQMRNRLFDAGDAAVENDRQAADARA